MSKTNSSAFQNEKARMDADKQFTVANLSELQNKSVNNVGASVFNQGDVIDCASIEVSDVRAQKFSEDGDPTYLVLVEGRSATGAPFAKRLYFSTLTRQVPEYKKVGDTIAPTGVAKSAGDTAEGAEVFNEMMNAPTVAAQLTLLQGYGKLEVVQVIPVETARYQNGVQLNRLRTAKIPVFKKVAE